jgi:hypothetical protein
MTLRGRRRAVVAAVVVVAVVSVPAAFVHRSAATSRGARTPLTSNIPQVVRAACIEARRRVTAPLQFVCPPSVPDVPYVNNPNLHQPMVYQRPTMLYMLTFNNGQNGPSLHWIVGAGSATAIKRFVLDDRHNEARGRPHFVMTVVRAGFREQVYKFPPFPAGGPNGGHIAAFVALRCQTVFASVHGTGNAMLAERLAVVMARATRCR